MEKIGMKLKPGNIVNMYNEHTNEGLPKKETLYGKGVLLQRAVTDIGVWDGFESWSIFVFWDRNNNSPHIQHLWLVHGDNDLSDDWMDEEYIAGKQPDELIAINDIMLS
jgi:hypothetical protein